MTAGPGLRLQHGTGAPILRNMIQIIEDDLVTCHIISALLKHLRFAYCEAHTGSEALEQLRSRPIDLVIADMMLPDMHGLDLLAQKHQMPHLRDIPVICCTAQADLATVEAAIGFGAVDFVRKPIVMQLLSERINRALARTPARWESWRDMSKRLRFHSRTLHPMLTIAQQMLRDLDEALARAETAGEPPQGEHGSELDAMLMRARGAALNVGAIRTVDLLDRLWSAPGAARDIAALRAALLIEIVSFDEAIAARVAQGDMPAPAAAASAG